jgi:predicted nucleotidyltransferase
MRPVQVERLERAWEQWPTVEAVWLFGSAQDGWQRDGADVDLGVLFSVKPSLDILADLRAALQEALQIDDIDLVPLNDASSILRFEAVRGHLLFERSTDTRAGFVSLTAREYEDEMGMIEKALSMARGEK